MYNNKHWNFEKRRQNFTIWKKSTKQTSLLCKFHQLKTFYRSFFFMFCECSVLKLECSQQPLSALLFRICILWMKTLFCLLRNNLLQKICKIILRTVPENKWNKSRSLTGIYIWYEPFSGSMVTTRMNECVLQNEENNFSPSLVTLHTVANRSKLHLPCPNEHSVLAMYKAKTRDAVASKRFILRKVQD